ncbi:hypothetical protein LK491_19920, partial [Phocaeicola vulgatus]|nr:hypothetical protein [Phocaeicola vulgatus]
APMWHRISDESHGSQPARQGTTTAPASRRQPRCTGCQASCLRTPHDGLSQCTRPHRAADKDGNQTNEKTTLS